jgi:hypothetical protein
MVERVLVSAFTETRNPSAQPQQASELNRTPARNPSVSSGGRTPFIMQSAEPEDVQKGSRDGLCHSAGPMMPLSESIYKEGPRVVTTSLSKY